MATTVRKMGRPRSTAAKKQVSVMLPPKIEAKVRADARRRDEAMGAVIRRIVARHYNH